MICCRKYTEGQFCDNCKEPLPDCKNGLEIDKLPHEKMKFYTGDLGPESDDWMIFEVKFVRLAQGKNYDGSKKHIISNELYKDCTMRDFGYRRDYDANSCKYFCKRPPK